LRQAYDYWQDQPGNYGAKTNHEPEITVVRPLSHSLLFAPHNALQRVQGV